MPLVGTRSLYAMGSPANGAFERLRSRALAAFSAWSGRKVTRAFTFGLTRSICAMNAFVTSVAETLRARIMRARRRAGVKQSSVINTPACRRRRTRRRGCRWARSSRSGQRPGSHQDDVELLLSVARLHLHRHALADEVGQHLERRRFLLEEAVDHALRGEDAELARLVEGARLAQDLAQDLVAHGVGGLHFAAPAAGRAGLAQHVRERLAGALARHLDQTERGEAVHRDAGAVARERPPELFQHRSAMLV